MANLTFDMRELEKFAKEVERLANEDVDSFFREASLMLAGEFLHRVIERTPRGEYPDMIEFTTSKGEKVSFENPVAGKQGGHLKNSWKLGKLEKLPDGYEIEIFNNATTEKGESYASHVEYGHRITNKKGGKIKGFKRGKFMMTHTEIEMAFIAPELLASKFEEFLRRVFA